MTGQGEYLYPRRVIIYHPPPTNTPLKLVERGKRSSLFWWGGEVPHATLPRDILSKVIVPRSYRKYCLCRIVTKCRIDKFASQNDISAHWYNFIHIVPHTNRKVRCRRRRRRRCHRPRRR